MHHEIPSLNVMRSVSWFNANSLQNSHRTTVQGSMHLLANPLQNTLKTQASCIIVADGDVGEWLDPEGNGVTMGRGVGGGLAHPVGNEIRSWSAAVKEVRLPWGNKEDSKTGPMWHQELIMHRVCNFEIMIVALLYIVITMCNCNPMPYLDLLLQENKSYGSKKPFAIILWCTQESRRAQLFQFHSKIHNRMQVTCMILAHLQNINHIHASWSFRNLSQNTPQMSMHFASVPSPL